MFADCEVAGIFLRSMHYECLIFAQPPVQNQWHDEQLRVTAKYPLLHMQILVIINIEPGDWFLLNLPILDQGHIIDANLIQLPILFVIFPNLHLHFAKFHTAGQDIEGIFSQMCPLVDDDLFIEGCWLFGSFFVYAEIFSDTLQLIQPIFQNLLRCDFILIIVHRHEGTQAYIIIIQLRRECAQEHVP